VSVGRDGTDLGAAIRRGLAEVPADSAARIVLLSDGVATRGDTLSAAAAAVAAEIPVDVVTLEQRTIPDIRVVALRAPTRADEGEAIDLRLVTSSPSAAAIEVRLFRDGEMIAKAGAKMAAGQDVLRIRETAPGPGFQRYELEMHGQWPRTALGYECTQRQTHLQFWLAGDCAFQRDRGDNEQCASGFGRARWIRRGRDWRCSRFGSVSRADGSHC